MRSLSAEAEFLVQEFKKSFHKGGDLFQSMTGEQIARIEIELIQYISLCILAQHPELRDEIRAAVNSAWKASPRMGATLRELWDEKGNA